MAKRKAAGSASERLERQLVAAALEKISHGGRPNREERAALKRAEKLRDEQLREVHYRSIRKKEWREWSGRQAKILNEQAARWGIPIGAATIELPAVVRWLHDFIAANARKLSAADDEDPAIAGAASPALERKRIADAKLAELNYEKQLATWIPRTDVHAGMTILRGILRKAGEQLQRGFGDEAYEILDEALLDMIAAFENHFGKPTDSTRTDSTDQSNTDPSEPT